MHQQLDIAALLPVSLEIGFKPPMWFGESGVLTILKKNARAKRTKLLILLLHMQMFDVHVAGLLELPIHWRQMKKRNLFGVP